MTKRTAAVLMTLYRGDDLVEFERAVASIRDQDALGLDIRIHLCIDGPIPQEKRDWLSRNGDKFRKILANAENVGLAQSLNRLIENLGDEEFVFRMDGDDISDPRRFAAQVAFLDAHPDIVLVGCQALDIDDEGIVVGERNFPTDPAAIAGCLHRANPVLHPTYCIRRDVLANPNIRYPKAYLTEDLAFVVTLHRNGYRMANLTDRLFYWKTGRAFFDRRSSVRRGMAELVWYTKAIGPRWFMSPKMIFPVARCLIRCMPASLIKIIYGSPLRRRFVLGDKVSR